MPNIKGFRPLANPDWIELEFDDGSTSHAISDPTGTYRAEVGEIVKRLAPMPAPDPMAGAVAGPGGGEPPFEAPPHPPANAIFTPPGAAPASPVPAAPAPVAPTPALASAPRTVIPEATPKGMVRAGQQRQTTGMAADDAARVETAFGDAEKAGSAAADEDFAAKATQYWMEFGRLREDEKRSLAQRSAAQEEERKLKERVNFHVKQMEERQARPIDGAQALAGDAGAYAFMAAFGDAVANFGAALMGQRPVADPAERINQIVERSIRAQMADKQAAYEQGKLTLAQLEGERERIRSDIATYGKQLAESQEALRQTEAGYLGLGAIKKHFEAQQATARVNAAQALARQETLQDTYAPPAPAKGGAFVPSDRESQALAALLGPDWRKQYDDGMGTKVQTGENAATVAMAIPMVHEMNQDLKTLEALAAANGGTIPTRGVINIPEALRPAMARMGIKSGMAAEEAGQLMTGYVLRKARSYGGAVTAPDYENAEKEFGQSGDGFIRGIRRMRDATVNGVRSAMVKGFRGHAQPVMDITLGAYGRTKGIENLETAEEFEVQSAPPAQGGEPQFPETPTERANRERYEGRRDAMKPLRESEENKERLRNPRFGMPY